MKMMRVSTWVRRNIFFKKEKRSRKKQKLQERFVSLSLSLSLSLSVFCGERERESRLASGVSVLVRYVIMCCTSILP